MLISFKKLKMGLFFGKKKKDVKVPQPVRKISEEQVLSFSKKSEPEKVLRPEQMKAAAGVAPKDVMPKQEAPHPLSTEPTEPQMPTQEVPMSMPPEGMHMAPRVARSPTEPVYLHVKDYQRVLGELDDMKKIISELSSLNKALEKSEFNEGKHYNKLKLNVKNIHDKLLSSDHILFKS